MALAGGKVGRLPPDANRILWVKNLNYKTQGDDLYDLFGKYGAVRQIRLGNEAKTRGTAFVVYEDVMDAKNAFDHLNGFHLQERYLVVLYHQAAKLANKADIAKREQAVIEQKKKFGIPEAE